MFMYHGDSSMALTRKLFVCPALAAAFYRSHCNVLWLNPTMPLAQVRSSPSGVSEEAEGVNLSTGDSSKENKVSDRKSPRKEKSPRRAKKDKKNAKDKMSKDAKKGNGSAEYPPKVGCTVHGWEQPLAHFKLRLESHLECTTQNCVLLSSGPCIGGP
jgi:hypothetical protein